MKNKYKSSTVNLIMDIVKTDPEVSENTHLKLRHYLSLTFDATWNISGRSQLSNRTKPVKAISHHGHELGTWPTMKLAAEEMQCEQHAIYRSIKHNRPMRWSKKGGNKLMGVRFQYLTEL